MSRYRRALHTHSSLRPSQRRVRAGRTLLPLAGLTLAVALAPRVADACAWAYPIGDSPNSPAPLSNNHPVGGMNLPHFGTHLGADYWSGGGCTDFGQTVYAVADGTIVEIVDGLGSYLDVVVIQHEDPQVGTVYSMYGHISRDADLAEGQVVDYREPIGFIDDVLAHFSPCHLHFELMSEAAYSEGPFCNGCSASGWNVSPGYDQQVGVTPGAEPSGDTWLEVNDSITDNRWYHTDAFIDARLDATCGECGDGTCDFSEDYETCAADCDPCALIPASGGTLDDAGPCFDAFGPNKYWSIDSDNGFEGSARTTLTTDSQIIDNYGVWTIHVAESGTYTLAVFVTEGTADSVQAAYEVNHAGGVDIVTVDQTVGGWLRLGEFDFTAGSTHTLRLNDNTGEPFADQVRLVFDGVELTPLAVGTSGGPGGEATGADPTEGQTTDGEGETTDPSTSRTGTRTGGDDSRGDGTGSAGDTDTPSSAGASGATTEPVGGCTITPKAPAKPVHLGLLLLGLGALARRRRD